MQLNFPEIMRFAFVGLLNLGVDLVVFTIALYGFDFPLLIANTLAYGLATINSYVLNKYWTFASRISGGFTIRELARFVLFNLVGLALSNLTVYLLVVYMHPIISKLYAVGVTFIWNYATNRYFVFRDIKSKG